ncbi:hypothetical protein BX600DRAFT_512397 [Xylariales sp. PMI_506]|nr:hypothetical protein BX600DRAFT_512397 [Xylariales sp. PMI_506]
MNTTFSPGIVVLNKKYFPRDALSAAQVGASSFSLSVLKVLHDARILCGLVLYKRDETLREPQCEVESNFWDGTSVVTVAFNFRMAADSIAAAFAEAFDYTMSRTCHPESPIVYYQTDTILQYHPAGFSFCVTHHGPFVSHFTDSFSAPLAQLAFGGDSGKVGILDQQQQSGIARLLEDPLGTVLAHSGLQQRILEKQGLDSSRFKRLRPPIGVPQWGSSAEQLLPADMLAFIAGAEVLLFTAVARLDYFKNVELMVAAGIELLDRGVPVRVLAVGDPEGDESRRSALLASIPQGMERNFMVVPRLPKDHLYALFAAARANGVFLCPSRYETLGITPLEAAASGIATLMTESPNVEALAYIPERCRVPATVASIAARVQEVHSDGISSWAEMTKNHVRPATSLDGFGDDLLRGWAEMSCLNRESTFGVPVASAAAAAAAAVAATADVNNITGLRPRQAAVGAENKGTPEAHRAAQLLNSLKQKVPGMAKPTLPLKFAS